MQVHDMIQRAPRSAAKAGALALLALSPLLGSCASTAASPEEVAEFGAVRASMVDFAGGRALTLVNETYAERNAGQAIDGGTKVSTDEVVAELVKFYTEEDFWEHARPGDPGPADGRPTDSGQQVILALTMQDDSRSGWLPLTIRNSEAEKAVIQTLGSNFTALWNTVESYRGVYNPSGTSVFKQPALR